MVPASDAEVLRGIRVIIVEDSFAVAESLAWLLTGCGCEVVAKASNVVKGMDLAKRPDYEVAVLDVRLGDDLISNVARTVRDSGRQIVYLTGYSDVGLIPEDLRNYPTLSKPVQRQALIDAVRKG